MKGMVLKSDNFILIGNIQEADVWLSCLHTGKEMSHSINKPGTRGGQASNGIQEDSADK